MNKKSDENFLYKYMPEACGFAGMIICPIFLVFLMAMNHYGYTDFRLSSYNKFHVFTSLGYMTIFHSVSKKYKASLGFSKEEIDNDVFGGYEKPTWLQVLFCIQRFASASSIVGMFFMFFLIYSK